jgi:chromosome segregation protein
LKATLWERKTSVETIENKETQIRSAIFQLSDENSGHLESKESLVRRIETLAQSLAELTEQSDELKAARLVLHTELEEKEAALKVLNHSAQETMQKKSRLEAAKERAENSLDSLLNYLQEEYSLSYEAAAEIAGPRDEAIDGNEVRNKVRGLKREIDSLGPVNVSAIEQFAAVNERYTFLTTQRDDLLEAKKSLFETMDEMDVEVKTRFKEVFDEIKRHFAQTFPSMFGGGRAELILTDPDDLLNTGIEIEAQPPGKKLQKLSLLSGGERALTAIALLFSIIQVRPVPFCVLDEVEAALDDANVSRFGHYLSHFEDETQFIVVTHRKGTMESANVLYGVTMQESGVSKIVSVRLEDVADDGQIDAKKLKG